MSMIYDVIIATPGTMLHASYVKSLTATLEYCQDNGIKVKWINGQGSPVHLARESVMLELDKYNYNKVLFIDSDISWTIDNFLNISSSPHDIVMGGYMLFNGKATTVHRLITGQPYTKEEITRIKETIEIDSGGFGFICVNSKVFDSISKPYFAMEQSPISPTAACTLGEDISWCNKVKRKGYKIYFDPRVLLGHTKSREVVWK